MPGFGDYFFIFVLALILFGPKKLPELARQLGKLMGEFRRASNEFKMQMEEELRSSERAEQEKKIAALEAAAGTPAIKPEPDMSVYDTAYTALDNPETAGSSTDSAVAEPTIAEAGELTMKPPTSGLPVAQTPAASAETTSAEAVSTFADSIPAAEDKQATHG